MSTIPGMDVIGYGYDAIGGVYASISSVTHPLYDFSEEMKDVNYGDKIYKIPKEIEYKQLAETNDITIYGKTIEESCHSPYSKS